ncbi:DUF2617 domain-containing protein [Carbonactinospora thermoautotrophica]|uniref:DUF2617 domain-containing protein n=1 Tax=Carbonactinospora thermoautotrophica TaxID=1469144 RepID=A0A132MM51_9ACTN|nr:DUF2617 family protein [Carbonactinospora thermoautotrophica]KWW97788.1 hypothetical protein TH66_20260 [Carbonactinospora thermoautotrophica]KWW98501.1 hypothetical protein LI90_123 [Carbonactinospora thermoautotrophica]KWX06740.1 hypothetical protein TR74_21105 [Carbonactinospora thermoautotrophica]MCX9193629.1 DUF2617 domain-containing protein [Carbonactinospora thermoautotrophica]
MRTALDTPYTDVCAGQLIWQLGGGPRQALAMLPLQFGDVDLELRLLGASHQVLLASPRGACVETVACVAGQPGYLPEHVSEQVEGWRYEFRAVIKKHDQEAFVREITTLTRTVEAHPAGLVGQFPGSPLAVTILLAQATRGVIGWRTWHAYPQSWEIVTTESRVEPR